MRNDVNISEAYVILTDQYLLRQYALYNNKASEENNALSSYTIYGGENDPFERIVLKVPKKKLEQIASDLVKSNGIVTGVNEIRVNAVGGRGTYIVSKTSLSGNDYIIEGYCTAYRLTKMYLEMDNYEGTPMDIIKTILNSKVLTGTNILTGKLKYWCVDKNTDADILTFKKGQSYWYILQVCATYLGCRIFFTANDAYLVDYRVAVDKSELKYTDGLPDDDQFIIPGLTFTIEDKMDDQGRRVAGQVPDAVYDFDAIELYTKDSSRPEYGAIVGQVSLGSEGVTPMFNKVSVTCEGDYVIDVENIKAQKYYRDTEVEQKEMTVEILKETPLDKFDAADTIYHQGTTFASNLIDYRCETQQSVEFSMKEYTVVDGDTHWVPFFPPSSRIAAIDDDLDDIHVDNKSVLNPTIVRPQKLILSSYKRNFPDGSSTYKFGVIASVDLSQKISDLSAGQQ